MIITIIVLLTMHKETAVHDLPKNELRLQVQINKLETCDKIAYTHACKYEFATAKVAVCMVVIQFLSGIFLLAEIAGFMPFLLQLLTLHLSTLLDSEHPPSTNLLYLLFHLLFAGLLRLSLLCLAMHFKIQSKP